MKGFSFPVAVLAAALPLAAASAAGDPMAGKAKFAMCGACHAVAAGAPRKIGPNLAGVVGRKAGAEPGFVYSPALKASRLVWNDATLDKWLASPFKLVPGNRMAYAGMPDAAARANVIAYLRTLKK